MHSSSVQMSTVLSGGSKQGHHSSQISAVWPPAARPYKALTRFLLSDIISRMSFSIPRALSGRARLSGRSPQRGLPAAKVHPSPSINPPAPQIITSLALLNLGDTTTSRAQKKTRTICRVSGAPDEKCTKCHGKCLQCI